jgi:uncharacterized protein (DUF58 family)
MIDPGFFNSLDSMALLLKRNAFGKFQGEQKTAYAGDGLTFKDYARYVVGDDFRFIDWRVYARTRELFVKRFEADRNLAVHILLDGSGSMAYAKNEKFSHAAMMALGIAYIAEKNNERISFAIFGKEVKVLKRQSQSRRVQSLVHEINAVIASGGTTFDEIMLRYYEHVKSKSLIFIVSDFLYPIDQLDAILERYGRSQVFLVQVLHKDEITLPFAGDVKFVDPEDESSSMKTYMSDFMRKSYSKEMNAHNEAILATCKKHKANFIQLDTRSPAVDNFAKLWQVM